MAVVKVKQNKLFHFLKTFFTTRDVTKHNSHMLDRKVLSDCTVLECFDETSLRKPVMQLFEHLSTEELDVFF